MWLKEKYPKDRKWERSLSVHYPFDYSIVEKLKVKEISKNDLLESIRCHIGEAIGQNKHTDKSTRYFIKVFHKGNCLFELTDNGDTEKSYEFNSTETVLKLKEFLEDSNYEIKEVYTFDDPYPYGTQHYTAEVEIHFYSNPTGN